MPPEDTATGTTETVVTQVTTEKPWYDGMDAETVGHIQNRGWHEKPPATAAQEAVKAYRELERFRGVPGDEIARVPKDASDEAGWLALRTKLGVPNDPTMYEFTGVQRANQEAPDEATIAFARETAAALHLNKDDARELLNRMVKRTDGDEVRVATERTGKLEEQKAALKSNWGANYDAFLLAAKNTALSLGVKPEQVAALENEVGYAAVMDMFRNIAGKIGEDTFITGGGKGVDAGGLLTKEQATARISELKDDAGFRKRYFDGDTAARKEMEALHLIMNAD